MSRSRKNNISILSTLITKTTNIDNESILRNITRCNIVITAKKEKNFRFVLCGFELNSELESVGLALASLKDVEAVPAFF